MAVVAKLEVLTIANMGGVQQAFSKGTAHIEGFGKSLFAIGTAATVAGNAISAIASKMMQLGGRAFSGIAGQLQKISERYELASALGLEMEAFEKLRYAARLAGIDEEKFERIQGKLTDTIGEALSGDDEAAKKFDRLGLSAKDLISMNAEQRIMAIADAVKRLGWSAQTAAALNDIVGGPGRLGPKMMQFFGGGSEELKALGEEAKRTGIAFDDLTGAKMENAHESWIRLSEIWGGVVRQLVEALVPAIEYVGNLLGEIFGTRASVAGQAFASIMQGIGSVLMVVAQGFLYVAQAVTIAWLGMETAIIAVYDAILYGLYQLGIVSEDTFRGMDKVLADTLESLKKSMSSNWADAFKESLTSAFAKARKEMDERAAKVVAQRKGLLGVGAAQGLPPDKVKAMTGAGKELHPAALERGSVAAAKAILDAVATARGGTAGDIGQRQLAVMQGQDSKLGEIRDRLTRAPVLEAAGI